jgi:hypothetical protein
MKMLLFRTKKTGKMKKIMIAVGFLMLACLNSCMIEGHSRHHHHGAGVGVYAH